MKKLKKEKSYKEKKKKTIHPFTQYETKKLPV